jgi:predicted transcriptional regulator
MIRRFNRRLLPYGVVRSEYTEANEYPEAVPPTWRTVMPEITDVDPQKIDPHLTSKIVRSYVKYHTVEAGEVSALIKSVHGALSQLGRPNQPEEVLTPAVPVRQSVRHEYVVCLDCGYRAKMLRRHIVTQHRLSQDEYLKRWGLRTDHPLTAPAYSEQRSTMAKAVGFGRKPKAGVAPSVILPEPAQAHADPQSDPKPARRQSTRPVPKSNTASEAVVANMPKRSRRPGSKS